uniref:Uncharacterized protein n=1 Tax=Globodera rostochiensis TaxID=31243 RepID=A0A914HIU2_GLORO
MAKLCRFSRFFYALLLLLTLCSILMAEAAIWRMRTDKKAMRNALVRFGKRNAYRSSGEAFVGAAGFGDSGAHLLRDIGMDDRQTQWAAFGDGGAPRPIKRLLLWPEQ